MSRPPPKITCLFYTDLSVAAFLNAASGRALVGDLLVECGPSPALSFKLNVETPANYPGLAGLLGGVDIGSLAHPTDRLPAPIIFAPGAPLAPAALRGALALCQRPDERLDTITLIVPVGFARELGAALALADKFAIAWDVTAFPHADLVAFAEWLGAERLLSPENFAGLLAYAPEEPDRAHGQRIAALLTPALARLPGTRPAVITLPG